MDKPLLIVPSSKIPKAALVLIIRPGQLLLHNTAITDIEAAVTETLAQDLGPELQALRAAVEALNH